MSNQGYSGVRGRPKPWLIAFIVLAHVVALYGLARAFAPDVTASVERSIASIITVDVSDAPAEDPPLTEPEPDQGAQGDPGEKAVPKPVTAPTPKLVLKQDKPAPRASSTGTQDTSGAREDGDGTGADGVGLGTGSGLEGGGRGGIAVTKPEHVSGSIDNARDYPVPKGGRKARRGTQVIVKVIVGIDGRASNCSVFRSSPDAEADRITCQLVVRRLGFKPAQDANGDPVPAPFYWRQRWF